MACRRTNCDYFNKTINDCCMLNIPEGCEDFRPKDHDEENDPDMFDMTIDGLDHYGSVEDD